MILSAKTLNKLYENCDDTKLLDNYRDVAKVSSDMTITSGKSRWIDGRTHEHKKHVQECIFLRLEQYVQ